MNSKNLSYRTLRGVGYEPEARAGWNLNFLKACCQIKPAKGLNPDKPEIANYKHQITNKFQITISKSQIRLKANFWSTAGGLVIVIWLYFVFLT